MASSTVSLVVIVAVVLPLVTSQEVTGGARSLPEACLISLWALFRG